MFEKEITEINCDITFIESVWLNRELSELTNGDINNLMHAYDVSTSITDVSVINNDGKISKVAVCTMFASNNQMLKNTQQYLADELSKMQQANDSGVVTQTRLSELISKIKTITGSYFVVVQYPMNTTNQLLEKLIMAYLKNIREFYKSFDAKPTMERKI